MDPLGPRRSARRLRAHDTENKESTEDEIRDTDAEGTDEDSLGPGSNPDLAQFNSPRARERPCSSVLGRMRF